MTATAVPTDMPNSSCIPPPRDAHTIITATTRALMMSTMGE